MTIGYNIFVNSGVDKPGSADTIALIARELEHVFNSKCGTEIFCQINSNSILMGAHLGCLTMRHIEKLGLKSRVIMRRVSWSTIY
ncbi:hypothetical protein [Xanthomonas sp. WCS2018Cala2-21]|uniref:hypothetical protein n=1 Tax=Xanthomonas sp. WCS2018Cala2-21 TaxID=3073644 RepID=UPI00387E455B